MLSFRRRLRGFTWLALFAVLGLALAPTVSHALARANAAVGFNPWAEICSAVVKLKPHGGGAVVERQLVQADPRDVPAKAHAVQHDDCPLCGSSAAGPLLLPADPPAVRLNAGADFLPALFAQAPRPPFAWGAAQPRGPPVVS